MSIVSHSLRGRLIVLLLLVFVPAVAMMLYTHYQERRLLTGELERQVERLLRLTLGREQAVVAGSRAMLVALANAGYVDRRDGRDCRAHVETMVREQPVYLNLGYVDARGILACSAIAAPAALDLSDRGWFRNARDERGFAPGEYGASPITGDRVVTYAYPILGAGGEFEGVAFAATRLSWLEDMVLTAELPDGSLAMVVDADGRVLASHLYPIGETPTILPPGALRDALASRPGPTVLTAADFDPSARIYALAPLWVGGRALYLVIGLPVSAAVGVVNDALRANLVVLGLLALLSFAVAWHGSESLVMRRVRRLAGIADRVAAGDFSVRAGDKRGIRELDQVGEALDRMVTELERRERARDEASNTLRDSEARYRDLVELSPDAILITVAGRVRYANSAAVVLLKAQSLRQVIGLQTRDIVDPAFLPAVEERVARQMRGERVPRMEQRYRCLDGSVVDVEVSSASYAYRGERAIQVIARDITERKRMETELRRSEASLSNAQRVAQLGNWDLDIASGRLHWSEQIYRIFGLSREAFDASYQAFMARVHPEDRARMQAAQRAALEGIARLDIEHRIVRPDGTVRIVHELGDLTLDAQGRPCRLVGTVLDITERRQMFDALAGANQRLQRLSRRILEVQEGEQRALARELHDEIGQSLTAIRINVQSLKRLGLSGRPAERLEEMAAVAEEALNRVKGISLNLRPSQLDDLGLDAALRWNANRQAEAADFTVHLDLAIGGARFDSAIETACFRVCQEALTNVARHANARNAWISAKVADMQLFVEIRDDGAGFDARAMRQRAQGGQSFGLLGMEERVDLCGGRIEITSRAGGGTSVRAWFPLACQAVEAQA